MGAFAFSIGWEPVLLVVFVLLVGALNLEGVE